MGSKLAARRLWQVNYWLLSYAIFGSACFVFVMYEIDRGPLRNSMRRRRVYT